MIYHHAFFLLRVGGGARDKDDVAMKELSNTTFAFGCMISTNVRECWW